MKAIFDTVSYKCSKLTTKSYSTSFSLGIKFLNKRLHQPIYNIYGFVRFADEIVDTFHEFNKKELLDEFREETYKAIGRKISLNPILNSYQEVVNTYNIEREVIDAFLDSMEMDITKNFYSKEGYEKYILGSAEVVGLMCLSVFCKGEEPLYNSLKTDAMKLGAAYQKINFLRDLQADYKELDRSYFPGIDVANFTLEDKKKLEEEIEEDFKRGFQGIKGLPKDARFGVYMTYVYYYKLFKKIQSVTPKAMLENRVRIPNYRKYSLFLSSYFRHSFNIL
ncbi:MAG: phytoene/squalene synthase family protein [Cyclobacteriaceae bacterium]